MGNSLKQYSIGSVLFRDTPGLKGRLGRRFGIFDPHTHRRIEPVLEELRTDPPKGTVLDVGCEEGLMTFEAAFVHPNIKYVGLDDDGYRLAAAREKKSWIFAGADITFQGLESPLPPAVDTVLLIDSITKLEDPAALINTIETKMVSGGRLIVSVPTERYLDIFGRRYHEMIGHLYQGLKVEELDEMIGPDFERTKLAYHTGPFYWLDCWLTYRSQGLLGKGNPFSRIIGMIAACLRLMDIWNGPYISCTMFAVYRKK
jgi:SAM-dependent methyltransferase